jgi:predicted AAA+ superfamily ATPase
MYSRILKNPSSSFFLFGPRGTGKSTWLSQSLPAAKTIHLLKEDLYQDYLREPRRLEEDLSEVRPGQWVIIDEIQRLPHLLNEVHLQIESRKIKFALTGSSARKLRARGVNLLAGRAVRRNLHPFVPEEMGNDFDLQRAMTIGCVPLIVSADDPADTLKAYSETYLKEEIQAEALVRNLPGFARFLRVSALFHGQEIEATNIARDAAVARTTVQGYLEILQDTLIAKELPAFEANLRVRERRKPKLYFFDSGVVRALKGYRGPVTREESGPLLEGLVHEWLLAYRDYRDLFESLTYWGSGHQDSKVEVDFLISRKNEHHAIEVKAVDRLRPEHFSGLQAIAELKGIKQRILLYSGDRKFRTQDGIEVIPVTRFFRKICDWL